MGSTTMAVRLSLVVLLVLAALPCPLAHRGRGGRNYRTEDDRRETRRRLAGQRDPRRGRWNERGRVNRVGEAERREEGLKQFRQPIETTLLYEDSRIFRDLVRKKVYDDKQEVIEITTEQYDRDTSTVTVTNNDIEYSSEKVNIEDFTEVSIPINEEGSGESLDIFENKTPSTEVKNKKEGQTVTINGRRAVIKKRRRGKIPENTDNDKLSEITNTKIRPNYSGNPRQDNNEQQSTNYSAKYPRRLDKEGRQFRVNKRRRQGAATVAATGRQNINREIVETEEPELDPVNVMQGEKKSNEVLTQTEPQHSSTTLFKIPKLFEDLSFPIQERKKVSTNLNAAKLPASKPAPQIPFNPFGSGNINFSQFDAQFGGSVPPHPGKILRRPEQSQNIHPYSNTISKPRPRTNNHQSQIRQHQPSPERNRSLNLFRGHPAQRIDMNTGSYSFTTRL